jgi:hypothetical protein
MGPVKAIQVTVKDGRLELQVPPDWPDGITVEIHPVGQPPALDDEGPLPPEEIARFLALMDQAEALVMTDEERRAWEADRRARKDWEKAHFDEHADKLRRIWE